MDFTINLKAGQWQRQDTPGRMFLLVDPGAAGLIELVFDMPPGQNDERVSEAKKGFKARLAAGNFSGVMMRATVDTTAKGVISDNDIDFSFSDGASVSVLNSGTPIQVSNDRGAPGNPIYVNSSISGLPAATAIANGSAVAVTSAGQVAAAANANRIRLILTNLDPVNAVAVGGTGLTWAKRAIVLQPGDSWVEERAANLAWAAICDAALSASLGVQEVTA